MAGKTGAEFCCEPEPLKSHYSNYYRGFTLSVLLMALGGVVNFGGQVLLPLYFRKGCQKSLAEAGLLLTHN